MIIYICIIHIYTTRVKYAQKLFKAFVQVAARSRKKHLLGHWGILGNAPFYKLLCHIATGLLLDPPPANMEVEPVGRRMKAVQARDSEDVGRRSLVPRCG